MTLARRFDVVGEGRVAAVKIGETWNRPYVSSCGRATSACHVSNQSFLDCVLVRQL